MKSLKQLHLELVSSPPCLHLGRLSARLVAALNDGVSSWGLESGESKQSEGGIRGIDALNAVHQRLLHALMVSEAVRMKKLFASSS